MRTYVIVDTRERGNNAVFWGPKENGYTTDLDKAGVYTEEEANRIERRRSTDRAVPYDMALEHSTRTVDAGLIRHAMGLDSQPRAKTLP